MQRFANPPSALDALMVDALAAMWIAGAVSSYFGLISIVIDFIPHYPNVICNHLQRSIDDGVMKLFSRITVENSSYVYASEGRERSEQRFA